MITLIEQTVISYLSTALNTTHVYAERPKTPPAEYYIVEKTGDGEKNHIQTSMIAVQSYAASLLRAAQMSKAVKKAMKALPGSEADVSRVRLNSAYNYTDPDTKEYRYQAVFDITYMEGEN